MTSVVVDFEEPVEGVTESDVVRAVQCVLEAEGAFRVLEVVVVSDRAIHELNRRWLGHDRPTDVVAFDLRDDFEGPDGEIYVSADTARREALQRGVMVAAELLLYCVHGALHLLGYDDHDPADRDRMHRRQAEIMRDLGYEIGS